MHKSSLVQHKRSCAAWVRGKLAVDRAADTVFNAELAAWDVLSDEAWTNFETSAFPVPCATDSIP